MKHLVLGSKGQVGRYVVEEIKKQGQEAVEWDIVMGPDYDLRVGSKELVEVMSNCDYVHFLASDVGGSKYLAAKQDSFEFIQNNVLLMDNVFSALRLTNKPFYYTSSQMSTMNHSTYGRLKAVGESYTRALDGTLVWFWNVYGLETDPEKAHVITDFIKMAHDDNRILCRTDGNEMRQFVYAKDVADILVNRIVDPSKGFLTKHFKVTNGEWVSIRQLANLVASRFSGCNVYFTEKKDTVQGVMNEPGQSNIGKYPFTPLKDGVWEVIREMYYNS